MILMFTFMETNLFQLNAYLSKKCNLCCIILRVRIGVSEKMLVFIL